MSLRLDSRTRLAAVVGHPIDHSLSPRLHNAWIQSAGLNAVYLALAPPRDRFAALVEGLRGGIVAGLNVTAPFKEQALVLADRRTPEAEAAGAANLLIYTADGEVLADNTDGVGLLAALAEQAPSLDLAKGAAILLGSGGAARGAAVALAQAGVPRVWLTNRTETRARALADSLAAPFGAQIAALEAAQLPAALAEARLVINATPSGLDAAAALNLYIGALRQDCVVMDMVYRPLKTPLLTLAEAQGLATVDGLAMLIGQARPSFRAFFGQDPPELDIRREALAP
jgi:shikimate dehydrogenase